MQMHQQLPKPVADPVSQIARRLRTALGLYETGVAMKRAQLRREDQAASEAEISRRLSAWLRNAPSGHSEGAGAQLSEAP